MDLTLDDILTPSKDVVSRLIGDDFILVPLLAGIGDLKSMLLFAWRFNRLIENLFIDKRIRRESY